MTFGSDPRRGLWVLLTVAGLAGLAPSAACAQWGDLRGRFVLKDFREQFVLNGDVPELPRLVEKGDETVKDPVCRALDIPDESLVVDAETGGIANVFVFLAKPPAQIHPDLQNSTEPEVVFDQKECRFIPHALFVRTDQRVLVKSDDATNHNTHVLPLLNKPENQMIAPGDREGVPMAFRIREPVPVTVTCDLHPWMIAHWLVLDHPYGAVTNKKGEFKIARLPAGTHALKVWHERIGWVNRTLAVTIEDGGTTDLGSVEIPLERFFAKRTAR